MALVDREALPLAQRLLACLGDARALLDDPPKNLRLMPGASPQFWLSSRRDECCEGLAWVRIVTKYPSSVNFPAPDSGVLRCGVQQLAVVLEAGIVRCAPTPDAEKMPSNDEWNVLVEKVMADSAALDKAICCFLDGFTRLTVVGPWQPLDVEGRCVGGSVTLTAAAPPCNCVDQESPS